MNRLSPWTPCTEDEVLELLLALDTSKPNGHDNISAKMLKSTAVSIVPVLTMFSILLAILLGNILCGTYSKIRQQVRCKVLQTYTHYSQSTVKSCGEAHTWQNLKRWGLRTLSIPTLVVWRLCTSFSYVNQLSIATIANPIHRVPPFQSRQIAIIMISPMFFFLFFF